jgi:DNA-binding CsgD family transcriptional regulator/DNA replicative helicase MCM subunit Mcm2 (Cdc46/Mcm family)
VRSTGHATPPGTPTGALVGRRAERAKIAEFLAALRAGDSPKLLVCGDPGVGKSALLNYTAASASDLRVLRAAGVQSEMELAFAVLHQLSAPLLDRIGELPEPQADALRIIFGLETGPPPDHFLVGLAVLGLLSTVAADVPVLCIVDDWQWLDLASARTLGFVARRLRADSVALMFAVRELTEELSVLPTLAVGGLRESDARTLLDSVLPFRLDDQVRDRIVAETHGNPLALLELPRGLSPTQLAGGFGMLDASGLSGQIEQAFRRRLDDLSPGVRQVLVVAAADPTGDPGLLWRAVDALDIPVSPAAAMDTGGLLTVGHLVAFRHPLARSVAYESTTPDAVRAAHLALADATDPRTDPDRRAWHLAAGATGPDEAVALELEHSAGRAQARGGSAAAAAFLQRAVRLTEDPVRRVNRALAAARLCLQAGDFEATSTVLNTAESESLDELQRAQVDLLRAGVAYAHNRNHEAPPLLLRAARALEALDPNLSRATYLDAWSAVVFAGRFAIAGGMTDVCRAALAAPDSVGPRRPGDHLLDGMARLFTTGRAAALPDLRAAVGQFASGEATADEVLREGWVASAAAATCWDFAATVAIATREVEVGREAGALSVLAVALNVLAQTVVFSGDFPRALLLIAEADAVREATGTRIASYGALVLAAHRGRESEALGLIEATISEATATGQGVAVQYALWARAQLLNGLGKFEQAAAAAAEASEDSAQVWSTAWALSELVEAAIKSDQRAVAATALGGLLPYTEGDQADWAIAIQARAQALLQDAPEAGPLFELSIEAFGRAGLRPDLARSHLLFGETLRRAGRRAAARQHLRTAHELFNSIGMEAFGERARRELIGAGESIHRRSGETAGDLTPQEMQIALLVRDGLSNPEVGARLFLSPRTVEWHLRKVFAKLSIGSRRELRTVLQDSEYKLIAG